MCNACADIPITKIGEENFVCLYNNEDQGLGCVDHNHLGARLRHNLPHKSSLINGTIIYGNTSGRRVDKIF